MLEVCGEEEEVLEHALAQASMLRDGDARYIFLYNAR